MNTDFKHMLKLQTPFLLVTLLIHFIQKIVCLWKERWYIHLIKLLTIMWLNICERSLWWGLCYPWMSSSRRLEPNSSTLCTSSPLPHWLAVELYETDSILTFSSPRSSGNHACGQNTWVVSVVHVVFQASLWSGICRPWKKITVREIFVCFTARSGHSGWTSKGTCSILRSPREQIVDTNSCEETSVVTKTLDMIWCTNTEIDKAHATYWVRHSGSWMQASTVWRIKSSAQKNANKKFDLESV